MLKKLNFDLGLGKIEFPPEVRDPHRGKGPPEWLEKTRNDLRFSSRIG